MADMELEKKYKAFYDNYFKDNKESFKALEQGQAPETLFITCSDSRILPNHLTNTKEGELFVIRNAGNLVPIYDTEDPQKESITIEYAVQALAVKRIIVCGHSHCGAMKAVQNPEALDGLPLLKRFITKRVKNYDHLDPKDFPALVKGNVSLQIDHLLGYPFIKEKVDKGELILQGWVYHFEHGNVDVIENQST